MSAGSVGMPYEGLRGAFRALLGKDVELRHPKYDVGATVAAIRVLGALVEKGMLRLLFERMTSAAATAELEARRGA